MAFFSSPPNIFLRLSVNISFFAAYLCNFILCNTFVPFLYFSCQPFPSFFITFYLFLFTFFPASKLEQPAISEIVFFCVQLFKDICVEFLYGYFCPPPCLQSMPVCISVCISDICVEFLYGQFCPPCLQSMSVCISVCISDPHYVREINP